MVPSIWNCIVPVADDGDTVAVNVTCWLNVEGFCNEESVVVAVTLHKVTTRLPVKAPLLVRVA